MKKNISLILKLYLISWIITGILLSDTIRSLLASGNHLAASMEWTDWSPRIGGCGGIFFKAEAGPLTIEFEKMNVDPGRDPVAVRLVLASPDRKLLADQWIRGTNESTARLETHVDHPGIYILMITASYDRYGERFSWRFRTNCHKYLIETSRGHRDAIHEEPIVLRDPDQAAKVCFLPLEGTFDITVSEMAGRSFFESQVSK